MIANDYQLNYNAIVRGKQHSEEHPLSGKLAAVFSIDIKWMPFLLESYTWCWNDEKEYTIIDKNGQAQYSFSAGDIREVKEFRNGHAPVRTKDGWGIVDYQGHWVLEPKYKDITMI